MESDYDKKREKERGRGVDEFCEGVSNEERKNKRKRRMEEYKEGARRLQRKRLDSNYHRQSDKERFQVQLDARKARGRWTRR